MPSCTFKLVYDELGATQHRMPPSLEKQITVGAQEFLGAHAYFFTEGRIPTNIGDHSKYFHIHDFRTRRGSWEALYTLDVTTIASEFALEYVRELTKTAAADVASLTKLAFIYLVHRSYIAWTERRPLSENTFDRIEPVFTDANGNGAPFYDWEQENAMKRRRLFDRTNSSISKMTSSLGRAATHVDLWLDEMHLGRIERRYSDDEIETALFPIREAWKASLRN